MNNYLKSENKEVCKTLPEYHEKDQEDKDQEVDDHSSGWELFPVGIKSGHA